MSSKGVGTIWVLIFLTACGGGDGDADGGRRTGRTTPPPDAFMPPFDTSPRPFPFPQERESPWCAYPRARDSAVVARLYRTWKQVFVTADGAGEGLRVLRPEFENDSVSEGIGYGMLLSVYLNDQPTFDGLWTYARARRNDNGLMNWRSDATGEVTGTGGATDADQDMAYALVMAARQWGGAGYLAEARELIDRIWDHEVDHKRGDVLKPGDKWGDADVTLPSYFSPAYYRVFARLTGRKDWLRVVDTSYELLDRVAGPHGLAPEQVSYTGDTVEPHYLFNSCRIPWRLGMDYCLHGDERAHAYLTKLSGFFSKIGAEQIVEGYDRYGRPLSEDTLVMAFVGPAAVGAMVSDEFQDLVDGGWNRVVALQQDPQAYNYYHATLGLLALVFLSGNFLDYTQL